MEKTQIQKIRKLYIDWYNTGLNGRVESVKVLYAIGEVLNNK